MAFLASFGIPALIAHFSVAATAAPLLVGVVGKTAGGLLTTVGTNVVGSVVSSQFNSVISHIMHGGQVTDEHRAILKQNAGASCTLPLFVPAQPTGPVTGSQL
jgi:hypothetical protein